MLDRLNHNLQRFMPLIAPASLVSGLVLGDMLALFAWLIPWLFALMTFSAALGLKTEEFRKVLAKPGFLPVMMLLLHVIMPLCAWLLGKAFYLDPLIVMGLVIIALTPAGSTSLVWTGIYKGNLSIALSVILADTLFSPLIIPVMLKLFVDADVRLNSLEIMLSLFLMILLPSIAAVASNRLSQGAVRRVAGRQLALLSKFCIVAILSLNGALVSAYLPPFSLMFAGLILLIFAICCLGYVFSFFLGKALFMDKADIMAFMLSGGLRNVGAGAAMSMLFFPPLTTFTVVIGMLFQQILGCNAGMLADKLLAAETVPSPLSTR